MVIIAIAAAVLVPSLRAFTIGRTTDNAATSILNLSNYARTQAVCEGRVYRLNFEKQPPRIWLTVQDKGTFIVPLNDFGNPVSLPTGVQLNVDVTPQPNTQLIVATDVQQTTAVVTPPYGQPIAQQNSQVQIPHTNGTYIEFQCSGRVDPAYITLTDQNGKRIDLGNASATEPLHVLKPGELQ